MTFNRLNDLVNNEDLMVKVNSIANQLETAPNVLTRIYNLIHDDSIFWNVTTDNQKRGLTYMAIAIYNSCFYVYNENIIKPDHCKYGEVEVYDIDATNGLRPATVNEVTCGVHGLIARKVYPAGEEAYRNIAIVLWMITDMPYYYKCAGLSLEYDKYGKVSTTTYEMLDRAADRISKAVNWLETGNVEKAIKLINKYRVSGGYKYAEYAKDEIHENISIKQLIKNINNEMPRNSNNKDFRRAISLVIKTNRDNIRLTPLEISWLRDVYDKLISLRANNDKPEADMELKSACDRISKAQLVGLLNRSEFVFKVIDTLKSNGYTKCSPKQKRFIDEAIEKLNNISESNNSKVESSESAPIITDDDIDLTLTDVSELIGQGLFE